MRRARAAFTVVALVLACAAATALLRSRAERRQESLQAPAEAISIRVPDPAVDRTAWPVIVAFGDSLTAGFGVAPDRNYPSQLQAVLDTRGYRYRVVNAGVSGEITAGGLKRVEEVLAHGPEIVILELGANDGLQARPVAEVRANLSAIIERLQGAGVTVVLAGMTAPPNFGPEYEQAFRQVFTDLAAAYQVPLIPFFLEGVAGSPHLNLPDGIHPTADGYAIVVQNVLTTLEPLLRR